MKKRLRYLIISVVLLLSTFIIQFLRCYPSACDTYAEIGIKGTISLEINRRLALQLNTNNLNYNEITKTNSQTDGSILSITVDTAKINTIALELSSLIYSSIENSENNFGIPLGNALGSKLLSGKGIKIGMTVLPIGATEYEIKSELLSSGINQTLHRISINFKTEIVCLAPFHKYGCCIENEIVIAETLVIGKVPEVIFPR